MHTYYNIGRFVYRLAAEKEVAAAAGRDCIGSAGTSAGMGRPRSHHHHHHHHHQQADAPPGPSSLFLFSTDNPVRRYTKFIIEWPYPFETTDSCRTKLR